MNKQIPPALTLQEQEWRQTTLLKICGDFDKTIKESEKLLEDHSVFGRGRDNFVVNVRWNLLIEPEVQRLRDRVHFHNVKILTVLKPLETRLLLDLGDAIRNCHEDLASRITDVRSDIRDVRDLLLRVEGKFTTNAQEASAQASGPAPHLPPVPSSLEVRFHMATRAGYSELVDDQSFPFYKGIDAFHRHFDQGTVQFKMEQQNNTSFFAERTPSPAQYLNLWKGIWIITMMKKSREYAAASDDRTSEEYMKEIEKKCVREHFRFSTEELPSKKLNQPEQTSINMLRDEEFRIWLDSEEDESDYRASTDYLNEILRVTMDSRDRNTRQELVLIRKSEKKLQLQNFTSRIAGPPSRDVIRDWVNLDKAYFVPLYATPQSSPRAMNVIFRGDQTSSEDTALMFLKMTELLDFQQAITGYKVVLDDADVATHGYQSTGVFTGKHSREVGRIQIWQPRRLEKRFPKINHEPKNASQQRLSVTSGSSTAPSVATTFSTACTTPVETGTITSFSFELPSLPIIVLFLRPEKDGAKEMSLLALQSKAFLPFVRYPADSISVDPSMSQDPQCDCKSKKRACFHSTLSRSPDLLAQRITATKGDQVNLARLGKYQTPKNPVFEHKLKYMHVEFLSPDKREKFHDKYKETMDIYQRKLKVYRHEMNEVKKDHLG